MFSFWKLKKEKEKIIKDLKEDDKGNALFNICIKDKDEVLSPFYYDDKEVINVEFANMLDNVVSSVPLKKGVHLSLKCSDINDSEKERYSKAIKNYYENKMVDSFIKLKNNRNLLILTIFLAMISLVGLFLVNFYSAPWIIVEVVDVIAWVFVWEAVDLTAFKRALIRHEYYRARSLYKSKISY